MNQKQTEFEKAFQTFKKNGEYDLAQSAINDLAKSAFAAGWNAAGGFPPQPTLITKLNPPFENT